MDGGLDVHAMNPIKNMWVSIPQAGNVSQRLIVATGHEELQEYIGRRVNQSFTGANRLAWSPSYGILTAFQAA
jgi:hypothetical protein